MRAPIANWLRVWGVYGDGSSAPKRLYGGIWGALKYRHPWPWGVFETSRRILCRSGSLRLLDSLMFCNCAGGARKNSLRSSLLSRSIIFNLFPSPRLLRVTDGRYETPFRTESVQSPSYLGYPLELNHSHASAHAKGWLPNIYIKHAFVGFNSMTDSHVCGPKV